MSKYEGVHSCGPNCTQPLCVANRRIEELTADRDDIRRKYIAEAKETDRLQAKVEELEADNADSKREAESLAMSLWRRHYQDVSPDFELCDTPAGVITQIDNMAAGLQAKVEDADRQRSILQTNLDAETTRGNVLDRENERLQATAEVLEKYLKDALHLLFKSEGE